MVWSGWWKVFASKHNGIALCNVLTRSHQELKIGNSRSCVAVNRDGNVLVVQSGSIELIFSAGNKIMSMVSRELSHLFCPRIAVSKHSNILFILENSTIFLLCASTLRFCSAVIRLPFAASDIASSDCCGVVFVADSVNRHIYALTWMGHVLGRFCVFFEDEGHAIHLAVGPAGEVYAGSHRTVYVFSHTGSPLQRITREGQGFAGICGLAVSKNGRLCVCDEEGLHVQVVDSYLEKVAPFLADVIPFIFVILIGLGLYFFYI